MEQVLKYDERRKKLTRTINNNDNIKIGDKVVGTFVEKNVQEYDEDGIRYVLGELKNQKKQFQDGLASANRTLESTNHLEALTDDEQMILDVLKKAQQLDQRTKAQETHKMCLEGLQEIGKQEKLVRDAIGNHLVLD